MMKVILNIPNYTNCAFFSYVYTDTDYSMNMGCRSIGTDELHDGAEIVISPNKDSLKGKNNDKKQNK